MPRTGRPKDPNALKKRNWRAVRDEKDGLIAQPAEIVDLIVNRPKPPKWMCKEGKERWDMILDHVHVLRVFAPSDYDALATAVHCLGMWIRCERQVEKEGIVLVGKDTQRKNPAISASNDYRKGWESGMSRFGLSPADRRGVATEAKSLHRNAGSKSKMDQFG